MAVDFGRVFMTYLQLSNAAREGANIAAGNPTDTASINARVASEKNVQGQGGEGSLTITTTCTDPIGNTIACTAATGGAGAGNIVTVRLEERFTFFTPLIGTFFGGNFRIANAASATVLGYVPSASATQPPACPVPEALFTVVYTGAMEVLVDPSQSTPNSGVCNISGYIWTWGDGGDDIGTASSATHTYLTPGTYVIRLEVTNQRGTDTKTETVTVPFVAPTPSPSPSPGASPSPTPSPSPSPTTTPTPSPSPTSTPIACAAPTANFTWTQSGQGNKTYTYRDASTVADPANCPITDWEWTFEDLDDLKSNAQNPAPVTYGNNRAHWVTLKVTNQGGTTTVRKST